MMIALDYDKTYTADAALWDAFIELAKARGHTVQICTMRRSDEAIENPPVPVVYTSRKAKSTFLKADIWIDDNPMWIYQDSL